MTIDNKTAKHICNVIRRQVQNSFPDLYISFIAHEEGTRKAVFFKEQKKNSDSHSGYYMVGFLNSTHSHNILEKDRSQFSSISHYNNPGFLGFFKNTEYFAQCFINYDHFENEKKLRNHAFHIAWHAIALYKDFIADSKNPNLIFNKNIITPNLSKKDRLHRNLMADIFSATTQKLQGKTDSLNALSKQRISATLSAETGFIAENLPFPVCLNTLEYIFETNLEQYKNSKKPIIAATNITEKTGATYGEASIEQWRSFSIPAQEMAWAGFPPETILGAALYTSENIYTQSIADMIAERMNIKPEIISSLQEYNPFTDSKTNEHMHIKQCTKLINTLLGKVHEKSDYQILIDIAKKQNRLLLEKPPMGWCASALISAANTIKQSNTDQITGELRDHIKEEFTQNINSICWDTLAHLSKTIFEHRRARLIYNMGGILLITEANDEFISIHQAITFTES